MIHRSENTYFLEVEAFGLNRHIIFSFYFRKTSINFKNKLGYSVEILPWSNSMVLY